MRPPPILPSRQSIMKLCVTLLLALLACVTEYQPISWFYGYHVSLGPIFLLMILLLYGSTWALPAAISVYITLALLGAITWPQTLLPIAFIVVSGLLLKRFPDKLILTATVYWILGGLPISYLLYSQETGYMDGLGLLFGLSTTLNGIVAALVADMLISYSQVRRYLAPNHERPGYAFNKIVLHLVLVATTVPFFIFILINGYQDRNTIMNQINTKLDTQISVINSELASWTENDYRLLRLNGVLQLNKLKNGLRIHPDSTISTHLVLMDSNGLAVNVIGMDSSLLGKPLDWTVGGNVQVLNKKDFLWVPAVYYPYNSEIWRYAYIVREAVVGNDMKGVFLMPFSPYLEQSIRLYISNTRLLLLFFIITMILTSLLNRLFLRSLTRLTEATSGIPDKLSHDNSLDWPMSEISEIRMLTDNFRIVTNHLVEILRQAISANTQLNQQKEQLAQSEKRLLYLAYYDNLTGLPNRLSMKEHLSKELETLALAGWNFYLSILFIDLDRFKHVNDTLGHMTGDTLLRLVSDRLVSEQSNDTFIARISGDEFVVLLRHAEPDQAVHTAERIIEQFANPFLLNDQSLYIAPSIGMATAPDQGRDIDTLMMNADSAMYVAKKNGGKGYVTYSEIMNKELSTTMWLGNNLHHALATQQFELHYQLKMNSRSGDIVGMEALIRWYHPERGLIPPLEFIPVAEETGFIIPLGDWILRTACEQNMQWQKAGYPPYRIAVNLSARQFHNPRLVDTICDILADTGMSSSYLELEITESFLLTNETYVVEVLQKLRELGVFISIDDFGTGYSSLSQLRRLPVQAVKIDKSFIKNMDTDQSNDSIVKAVIQLAHSMNLMVVAEGVETVNEENLLRLYGCDELQGYLFGKPMSAALITDRLKSVILNSQNV